MKSSPFWVNNIYSLGVWLKKYAYYPRWLPLVNYMDHGMTLVDTIPKHEIENEAMVHFKFSPRLVQKFKLASDKDVYCILNPTVFYRRKKKIVKSNDARGSVFFVAHSTEMIDDLTNWQDFITRVSNIPDKYKPLTFCLHNTDIKKGLGKIFELAGFSIVTAGDTTKPEFVEKFYNILRSYEYSFSNIIGSYTFYAVEMGIPFTLYGQEPLFQNNGDDNIESGIYESYKKARTYQYAVSLFSQFSDTVSTHQREFVLTELGVYNSISRFKACRILYANYIKYVIKRKTRINKNNMYFIKNRIKLTLFKIVNLIYSKIFHKYRFDFSEKKLITNGIIKFGHLARLKRRDLQVARIMGRDLLLTDSFWQIHSLKEIFIEEVYKFKSNNEQPVIIDCGANIGLSIIYFKTIFPKARIIGFEADQTIFEKLEKNIKQFHYKDVELINKALWSQAGYFEFNSTGSLGGKLTVASHLKGFSKMIEAVTLRPYLNNHIDFLKIDIEGAEIEVIKNCSDLLYNVKNIFIEYHSEPSLPQELDTLLKILKEAGFRIDIKSAWNNLPYPFFDSKENLYYDLQLNISGYRM